MGAGTSVELLERIETHISIRSPHAGRDSPGNDGDGNHRSFQSTRPMRGETANSDKNCLQKPSTLYKPYQYESGMKWLQEEKGGGGRKINHKSGAKLPGIWCGLVVRIIVSTVHPTKEQAILRSAQPCHDSCCPAHRSGHCHALRPFRIEPGA